MAGKRRAYHRPNPCDLVLDLQHGAPVLPELPIQGRVVIGAEEGSLAHGTVVGRGDRPYDLALDPLEGRSIVARGGHGAMSMIAVGESGSLVTLPDMYMRKMAVGPRARGKIDINGPMAANIEADLGCATGSINVKAKTSEGLGFTGRGEGIAAMVSLVLFAKS